MVDARFEDVFVANEVVDPAKIARLVALAHRALVSVGARRCGARRILSREAVAAGVTIGVLIDMDILLHRWRVSSPEDAIDLARKMEHVPAGLRLRGVGGKSTCFRLTDKDRTGKNRRAYGALSEAASALRDAGFPVEVV